MDFFDIPPFSGDVRILPTIKGKVEVSPTVQQTVALLCGMYGKTRRLIKVSASGSVYCVSPPVKAHTNLTADEAAYLWSGTSIDTTEVIVKAHPNNSGLVVVGIDSTPSLTVGVPLESGESHKFTILNLSRLKVFIENNTEKAVVVYTD